MTATLPNAKLQTGYLPRGRGAPSINGVVFGALRLPTDPLYYFDITLENIVVGSRYRIIRHSTGETLAIGVSSSTTEVITGIPAYANSMLLDITIRNASGSPAYKIFDTAAYSSRFGLSVYVLQQLDE